MKCKFIPAVTIACCLLLALTGCRTGPDPAMVVHSTPGSTTTVILVRHADREPGEEALNDEGRRRAIALADALQERGVTAIYCPDKMRNIDTAQPLADRLGLKIRVLPFINLQDPAINADRFVDEELPKHAGGVVLFVGNSKGGITDGPGNMQHIYWRLGGTGRPPTRYQDMYIFILHDQTAGPANIIKAEYGGPSRQDKPIASSATP